MLASSVFLLQFLPHSTSRPVAVRNGSRTLIGSKLRGNELSDDACCGHRRNSTLPALAKSEHHDPGHWNFSPEWWGTQAGGWGHDAGVPVFLQRSHCGNGGVSVTAHHASGQGVQSQQEHQWRVLRFNDTRQSVARVIVQDNAVHAAAGCLAFEYLKTMAAAAAAIIGLSGKLEPCVSAAQPSQPPQQQQQANPTKPRTNQQPNVPDQHSADQTDHTPPQPPDRQTGHSSRPTPVQQSQQTTQDSVEQTAASQQEFASQARCHCLCLGLGAGSLPLFLSHHFPGMMVQAVELDPVVIAAATQEMGLPANRANLALHQAEAGDFVMKLAIDVATGLQPPVDLLCVDVFDGEDNVPASLRSADSPVLEAMAAILHPDHGTVIMNLHGGGMSTGNALIGLFTRLLSGDEHRGYHPSTEQGRAVQEVTSLLRASILHSQPSERGNALTLRVAHQSNIIVVVSRALSASGNDIKAKLATSSQHAAEQAGYLFSAGTRCTSGLTLL